jgi:hypothetical protein
MTPASPFPAGVPGAEEGWLFFDGMAWPNPRDPLEIEWKLRYGQPSREDLLAAASFVAAYKSLVGHSQQRRNAIVAALSRDEGSQ